MDFSEMSDGLVRDPLEWAADCSLHASVETEPQARDAYAQLAEEFAFIWSELEGLISTFEALARRRRISH